MELILLSSFHVCLVVFEPLPKPPQWLNLFVPWGNAPCNHEIPLHTYKNQYMFKSPTTPSAGEGVGCLGIARAAGGNRSGAATRKPFLSVPESDCRAPTTPLLGIHPR